MAIAFGWRNLRLVHLHLGLVSAIDSLVGKQSCSSNHRSSHSITNKHDSILGFWLFGKRKDIPLGNSSLPIIVGECNGILTGFVELDVPIGFGEDVDGGLGSCLLGE